MDETVQRAVEMRWMGRSMEASRNPLQVAQLPPVIPVLDSFTYRYQYRSHDKSQPQRDRGIGMVLVLVLVLVLVWYWYY